MSAVATGCLLAGTAVVAAAPGAGAAPPPSSAALRTAGKNVPRFAPVYMGWVSKHRATSAEAVATARAFDVVAANGTLAPYVAAMHAANPNLVIVDYVNALYSTPQERHPEHWYAHDSRGRRIKTYQFGNYLMDPTNAEWRRSVNAKCAQDMARSHYDGCFLDNLGQGPFAPTYVTAPPVNPVTRRVWDKSAWMAATSALARGVQAAVPSAVVIGNGLVSGSHFFGSDGTRPLAGSTDGAMSELWLRGPTSPVNGYRSEAEWRADVDMLAAVEGAGGSALVTVKLWIRASAAARAAWHKYALASFLLGSSGRSYFSFSAAQTFAGLAADSAWDRVRLGAPQGPYAKVGTAYRRTFSGGVAVVNPTGRATSAPLPAGRFRDLDGHIRSGSVPLAAQEGSVLTKIG